MLGHTKGHGPTSFSFPFSPSFLHQCLSLREVVSINCLSMREVAPINNFESPWELREGYFA